MKNACSLTLSFIHSFSHPTFFLKLFSEQISALDDSHVKSIQQLSVDRSCIISSNHCNQNIGIDCDLDDNNSHEDKNKCTNKNNDNHDYHNDNDINDNNEDNYDNNDDNYDKIHDVSCHNSSYKNNDNNDNNSDDNNDNNYDDNNGHNCDDNENNNINSITNDDSINNVNSHIIINNADNTIHLEGTGSSDQKNVRVHTLQSTVKAKEISVIDLKSNRSKPLQNPIIRRDDDDQQNIPCNRSRNSNRNSSRNSNSDCITRSSFTSRGSVLGYMKTPQRDDTGREDKVWSSDDQAMFSKVT